MKKRHALSDKFLKAIEILRAKGLTVNDPDEDFDWSPSLVVVRKDLPVYDQILFLVECGKKTGKASAFSVGADRNRGEDFTDFVDLKKLDVSTAAKIVEAYERLYAAFLKDWNDDHDQCAKDMIDCGNTDDDKEADSLAEVFTGGRVKADRYPT